jgi:hypothetical protein
VKDLLDAGLLEPGAGLSAKIDDMDALATVLEDGRIAFGESTYDTPSRAGYAAKGAATNGWTFWAADTADGPRTLADLRNQLLRDS